MYILILILPLISSILGLCGRWLGRSVSTFSNVLLLGLAWIISLILFFDVCYCANVINVKLYTWLLIENYNITFGLLFDPLSSSMIVVICTISMFVHLYSLGYMSHDPYLIRFMSYLSFFTFCMLILVTSDNFLQLFIGWEVLVYVRIY